MMTLGACMMSWAKTAVALIPSSPVVTKQDFSGQPSPTSFTTPHELENVTGT